MIEPLRRFVGGTSRALDRGLPEIELIAEVKELMRALVAEDTWLPEEFAAPSGPSYSQYLLFCDACERFSVVSFVWGPRQKTPIHNHTVWGVIGQLRGRELSQSYVADTGRLRALGPPEFLERGQVVSVSPQEIDVHRVENPSDTDTAISIHVYGANIGRVARQVFDANTGAPSNFVSSYTGKHLPNLWN